MNTGPKDTWYRLPHFSRQPHRISTSMFFM